jgi:hypothetical protein
MPAHCAWVDVNQPMSLLRQSADTYSLACEKEANTGNFLCDSTNLWRIGDKGFYLATLVRHDKRSMRERSAMYIQCIRQVDQVVIRSYVTNSLDIPDQGSPVVSRETKEKRPFR